MSGHLRRQETVCEVGESDEQRRWHPKFTVEVDINQCHFADFRINSWLFTTRTGASLHVYTLGKSGASEYFIGRPSVAAMLFPLTLMITKTRQKSSAVVDGPRSALGHLTFAVTQGHSKWHHSVGRGMSSIILVADREASCHTLRRSFPAINKLGRLPATSVINSSWSVAAKYIALAAERFTACGEARIAICAYPTCIWRPL